MDVRFEYRNGDVAVCFVGPRDFVEAMAARYVPVAGDGGPEPARSRPLRVTKNISLLDFIHLKDVSAPEDVVLALAYYLEKYDYVPNYDLDELRPYLSELELQEPEVAKALGLAVRRGLMVEEHGRYSLSFSGEQAVKYGEFPTTS